MDHFWDRRGFFVDTPGDDRPSGEGNVWPFWSGVITDASLLRQALDTLEAERLREPVPAQVRADPQRQDRAVVRADVHARLPGLHRLDLARLDVPAAPAQHRATAREARDRSLLSWIERDGTFWEVIDDETGLRYSSTFLTRSDESMLWSAIFLDLLENPALPPSTMRPIAGPPGST